MAPRVIPCAGAVQRHGNVAVAGRSQREAVRDAGHRPASCGLDEVEVGSRLPVHRLRQEHDVVARQRGRPRGPAGLAAVAADRAASFRPRDQVAAIVGRREGIDDADDRDAIAKERDGDRAAAMPLQVVPRAVVGIDQPDVRLAGGARLKPGFLTQVAPRRERRRQGGADDALGLGVRFGMVAVAARAAGEMEVRPEDGSRFQRRIDGHVERAPVVVGHGASRLLMDAERRRGRGARWILA